MQTRKNETVVISQKDMNNQASIFSGKSVMTIFFKQASGFCTDPKTKSRSFFFEKAYEG